MTVRRCANLRRGFSVMEVAVSNFLIASLAVIASSSMIHLGRPAIDQIRTIELNEQAQLVQSFLAQDLGGQLSRVVGGGKSLGNEVGRQVPDESELRICFDGGLADGVAQWSKPDIVVRYYLEGNCLIRYDEDIKQKMTVARHVASFVVTSGGSDTTLVITLRNRKVEKVIQFVALSP